MQGCKFSYKPYVSAFSIIRNIVSHEAHLFCISWDTCVSIQEPLNLAPPSGMWTWATLPCVSHSMSGSAHTDRPASGSRVVLLLQNTSIQPITQRVESTSPEQRFWQFEFLSHIFWKGQPRTYCQVRFLEGPAVEMFWKLQAFADIHFGWSMTRRKQCHAERTLGRQTFLSNNISHAHARYFASFDVYTRME